MSDAGQQANRAERAGGDTPRSLRRLDMPLTLGTKTQWGEIGAVGLTGGERYYWMTDKHGCVSMMPATVVEKRHTKRISHER